MMMTIRYHPEYLAPGYLLNHNIARHARKDGDCDG
jgi:hypothetical protein